MWAKGVIMSDFIISNAQKKWTKIATFWILSKVYRKKLRGILTMGVGNYIRAVRRERNAKFAHELAVLAVMKDEGAYLKEWLDFHILAGVEKFYLYDNESTDNTTEILKPYLERGIVEYKYWPGRAQQNPVYWDGLNRHKNDARWIAVIDLDEFVVPVQNKTITEFLHTLPRGARELVMTWVMYGSSGHVHKPDGLVIENFRCHADRTRPAGCKSIVNPRFITRWANPHINEVAGFIVDENGKKLGRIDQTNNPPTYNKIRCNHYVTKSFDEYMSRGTRMAVSGCIAPHRTPERFRLNDMNDICDPIMDEWAARVKAFKLK